MNQTERRIYLIQRENQNVKQKLISNQKENFYIVKNAQKYIVKHV